MLFLTHRLRSRYRDKQKVSGGASLAPYSYFYGWSRLIGSEFEGSPKFVTEHELGLTEQRLSDQPKRGGQVETVRSDLEESPRWD